MTNPYNTNLDKNHANYQPLTPISFLERAADVFPNHTAIVHGLLKQTYSDFYLRSKKLASALIKKISLGVILYRLSYLIHQPCWKLITASQCVGQLYTPLTQE